MAAAAPKKLDRVQVAINLDTIEKERSKPPFVAVLDDREITMIDPADMDWADVAMIGTNYERFLKYGLSEEDKTWLAEQKVPMWKVAKLLEAYLEHYDLPGRPQGNAASLLQ